jgi:hypothetical protein
MSASRNSPPDPLFLSKHPVAGKFDVKAPNQIVAEAPAPPAVPTTALAERSNASGYPEPNTSAQDGEAGEEKVIPATPVSRPKQPDADQPTSEAPATIASIYGHAPDYSWIRGVLDKHYRGFMNIRYCDLSEEDPYGGKFTLQADERLESYRDGDVVWIKGQLMPQRNVRSAWNPFRVYRVESIRLEQRPH